MMKKNLAPRVIIQGLILLMITTGGWCVGLSDIIEAVDVDAKIKYRTVIINDYDFIKAEDGEDKDYNLSMAKKYTLYLTAGADVVKLKAKLEGAFSKFVAGKEKTLTLENVREKIEIKNVYGQIDEISVLDVPISFTAGRFKVGSKHKEFICYAPKIDGFAKSISIKEGVKMGIGVFKLEEVGEFGKPQATATVVRDVSLYALTLSGKIPEGNVSFYLYDKVKETKNTDFSNVVLGVCARGSIPQVTGLSYDVELAMQKSLDLDLSVRPVKSADGLGARVKGAYETEIGGGDLRLAAEVIYTSGDKADTPKKNEEFSGIAPSYTPVEFGGIDYPTIAHDKGIVGKNIANLTAAVVNVVYRPAAIEGLRLGLAVANYQKTTTQAGEKKNYGNEIDISAEYTPTDNIILGGAIGYFIPGEVYQTPKDKTKANALKCVLETKLLF